MNREDHRQSLNRRIFFVLRPQQHRHQGGLPVVAVDHIGHPDVLGKLDRRAAELRESLRVVRIILSRHPIELLAVEVFRVLYKVVAHPAQNPAMEDRGKTQRVAHRDGQAWRSHSPRFRIAIPRKQHDDFMPQRNERLGQRFHHVRKTSRLREREPFGRDKKYFHISSSRASTVLKGSPTVKDHTHEVLVGQALLPVRFCGCEIVPNKQPLAGAREKEYLPYHVKQPNTACGTPRGWTHLLLHFPAVSPEKLGQHFLTNASWQERIAGAIHITDGVWVEIGAGHGEMTSRLARNAGRVIAIELDRRLAAHLREVTAPLGNVEVIESDVLAVDFGALTEGATFSVYGNLPYYITSPILHRLFEHADRIAAIHIVIQLEVAVRIVAPPGRRDYGYFSVASQWFTRPELVLRIPPGAFRPPPKIGSALVSLRMPGVRETLDVGDEKAFLDFVKECFAQKRKNLRNNLRTRLGTRAGKLLREAGLSLDARAEELSVVKFAELFRLTR